MQHYELENTLSNIIKANVIISSNIEQLSAGTSNLTDQLVSETSSIKELQEKNTKKAIKNIDSKALEIRSDLENVDNRIGDVLHEILVTNECIRNRFDESGRQNSGNTDKILKQLSLEIKKLVDQQLSYHNTAMLRLHDQNDKFQQFEKKYDNLVAKIRVVNYWEAGIIIALLLLITCKLFF